MTDSPSALSTGLGAAASALRLDAYAITLSTLCLRHCLAPIFIPLSLPLLGELFEEQITHRVLVVMALPASVFVLLRAPRPIRPAAFVPLTVLGSMSLLGGAFVDALERCETALTVAGAVALAAAHGLRLCVR